MNTLLTVILTNDNSAVQVMSRKILAPSDKSRRWFNIRRLILPSGSDFFAVATGGSTQYNKPNQQLLGRAFVQQAAGNPAIIRH